MLLHHPVELSASSVRSINLKHGSRMSPAQGVGGSVGVLPTGGAAHLIAQADGTMLPRGRFFYGPKMPGDRRKQHSVRWMEARLCAVRAAGRVSARYAGDLESVDTLGSRWARCAA